MSRRSLLVIPVAAAGSAVVGALALAGRPLVAALVGLLAGIVAAVAVGRAAYRRHAETTAELGQLRTRLQRRTDEVASERTRVERLLDSLPTAILLFEPAGLTYANPVAQSLFGVRRREARSALQVLGVEGLADAVTEARETGVAVDVEVERAERHLVAHASVTGGDAVALVVTDETDSRLLEAVRRDFVTNASHELKTPVAGMQALADSLGLAIDRDPQRARSMIVRLQIEATRLGKLVRELLDLSRLEEDAAAAGSRQRVDLAEIVKIQADRVGALADSRGVTLRCQVQAPAPVVGHPGDLRLIVANLLENAVRYNREGGRVDVRVDRNAGEVVLEVEDNGLGIAEADRTRVFERFYRVDKARSRAAGGTGLGLSIVRHATERHGGEVTVESVLGEGSVFRVILPVEGTSRALPDRSVGQTGP